MASFEQFVAPVEGGIEPQRLAQSDKLVDAERPLIRCGMCKRWFRRIHKFDEHMWARHGKMLDKDFVD